MANEYGLMSDEVGILGMKQGVEGRIDGGHVCAESAGIAFGNAVFSYKGENVKAYNFHNDVAKLVVSADLIASNSTIVTINGVATTATVYGTSHAATMAAIIVKIKALAGVTDAVLDAADTNSRTILVLSKGVDISAAAATTLGETQPTWAVTYGSAQVFLGVAMFLQKASSLSVASAQGYEQYDAMAIVADGEVMVKPSVTVEANDVAYYDNASTNIRTWTSSAYGVALNAKYLSNATSSQLARLRVNGMTDMTYADKF